MAFLSGKSGKVVVNGTTLNVRSWAADVACDLQETSHSGASGYKTYVAGLLGLTGTVEMDWDTAANPTTNPPNLNPGETLTNLDLYLDGSSYLRIASAIVSGSPLASAAD